MGRREAQGVSPETGYALGVRHWKFILILIPLLFLEALTRVLLQGGDSKPFDVVVEIEHEHE